MHEMTFSSPPRIQYVVKKWWGKVCCRVTSCSLPLLGFLVGCNCNCSCSAWISIFPARTCLISTSPHFKASKKCHMDSTTEDRSLWASTSQMKSCSWSLFMGSIAIMYIRYKQRDFSHDGTSLWQGLTLSEVVICTRILQVWPFSIVACCGSMIKKHAFSFSIIFSLHNSLQ